MMLFMELLRSLFWPGNGHCGSCSPNSTGKSQAHPQPESKALWGRDSLQPGQMALLKPESPCAQTGSRLKSQDGTGWAGQCHLHSLVTSSCPSASFRFCLHHFRGLQSVCDVEQGFLVVSNATLSAFPSPGVSHNNLRDAEG